MDIEGLAKKLQAFVREHRGLDVPILDHRRTTPRQVTEAAIVWTGWAPEFPNSSYGGEVCTDHLRFEMPGPDSGAALSVYFSFAEHDLSGQCDEWTLEVKHATADEIEALRAIFSPTRHVTHREPELVIDGVRQKF